MFSNRYTIASYGDVPIKFTPLWFVIFFGGATFLSREGVMEFYFALVNTVTPISITSITLFSSPIVAFVFGTALMAGISGSIIIHEIGHAYGAKRNHLLVDEIVLYALGGYASVSRHSNPRVELEVVAFGPLANLVLVVIFLILSLATSLLNTPFVAAYFFLLTLINAVSVVFNLIPVIPVDGGRILQYGLSIYIGKEKGTQYALYVAGGMGVSIAVISLFYTSFGIFLVAVLLLYETYKERKRIHTTTNHFTE